MAPLSNILENSIDIPHCYICAENGHFREMELVRGHVMISLRKWNKPWSPTQSCFQCGRCGRLTCWTHSYDKNVCKCGAVAWVTRSYIQKELDNG